MYQTIEKSSLFMALRAEERLFAKASELRGRVATYLGGVPATFSNFTSHAVDHSDSIVRSLSSFLHGERLVATDVRLELNVMETYLLVIASYMHDAGMVVTQDEKLRVLGSPEWRNFAAENETVAADVEAMQEKISEEGFDRTDDQGRFVAGIHLRLLLADYFRRQHAERSKLAINGALRIGTDFLEGDPVAVRTLEAICIGHGLDRAQLESEVEYPLSRDVFNYPVNVRLLTLLLRVGDLLDTRNDRACELMRSVNGPLPASSEAHWSQYSRIVSRSTSPDAVYFRAECQNAAEHKLLLDWFGWIEEEVAQIPRLIAGSTRIAGWKPPVATLASPNPTMIVTRSADATYRAEDWRYIFDEAAVIKRLVNDIHRSEFGYVRELLQNALDTTRTRMYRECNSSEPYPNLIPSIVRSNYSIEVAICAEGDIVKSVAVSDNGLGMTEEIVRDYFLQIGRSWYRSHNFESNFSFTPASGFGVGFLSVFAVSRDVVVTTRWLEADPPGALRIQLDGPANHILFEDASRASSGTTVVVNLDVGVRVDRLIRYLGATCRGLEFDVKIAVSGAGGLRVNSIEAFQPDPSTGLGESLAVLGDSTVRVFSVPSTVEGIFGSYQFLVLESAGGVQDWTFTAGKYVALVEQLAPLTSPVELPSPVVSTNGLVSDDFYGSPAASVTWFFDIRGPRLSAGLERNRPSNDASLAQLDLARRLQEHVDNRDIDFSYLASLVSKFESTASDWCSSLKYLPLVDGSLASRDELNSVSQVLVAYKAGMAYRHAPLEEGDLEALQVVQENYRGIPVIASDVLNRVSRDTRSDIEDRVPVGAFEFGTDSFVVVYGDPRLDQRYLLHDHLEVPFPSGSTVLSARIGERVLVNASHPFVIEVRGIGDEHQNARTMLLSSLAREHASHKLNTITESIGNALQSSVLLAYAGLMRDDKQFGEWPVLAHVSRLQASIDE